jgi:hypothetical protein
MQVRVYVPAVGVPVGTFVILKTLDERPGGGVLGPGAVAEEGGDGNRCEDPDDQDHDQQLDQREPVLIPSHLGLHRRRRWNA